MSELRHQEIIDRINYQYTDINGNVNFPNSFEGDVLKIAYKTAVAALKPKLTPDQQELLLKLKKNYDIHEGSVEWAIYELLTDPCYESGAITNNDLFVVLDGFKNWVQKQEE